MRFGFIEEFIVKIFLLKLDFIKVPMRSFFLAFQLNSRF